MAVQTATRLALKEWAAVIDAMQQGLQIVTLRKGGIREKSFLVEGRSFYLLPTYEHQAADLIKPEFRESLDRAVAGQRDDAGLIVRLRADVDAIWEIDDEQRLSALTPYHMFTDEYAQSRFNWRPKQPLTVLLLRAQRLEQAWSTGLSKGVGGCRSWLEIEAGAAPSISGPVIPDAEFEARTELLHAVLD
jgi:hypothetical protein